MQTNRYWKEFDHWTDQHFEVVVLIMVIAGAWIAGFVNLLLIWLE